MAASVPTTRERTAAGAPGLYDLDSCCATDTWRGDMQSGLFVLNATTRQILGLERGDHGCGLLTLVQSFEAGDHHRLLELFERAASEPTRFSFSTTVARRGKVGQSVFCIGRSDGFEPSGSNEMAGVFIFPHL